MRISYTFLYIVLCLASIPSIAALPLPVEDLITDKGKIKLDATFSYANNDRQGFQTGDPIMVQTGPTSFIFLPTHVGETQTNTDTSIVTLGLHYGLSRNAELYGRASYLWGDRRTSVLSSVSSTTEQQFSDAWLGLNYRFSEDDNTPALIGFVESILREQDGVSGKSWLVGMSSYRTIDPVVLSLTTGCRINQVRQDSSKPGNLLWLHSAVAFAANDRVSFSGGL